mmetsp:Transcript_33869/g.87562  ORF Transcript_33869/g.87562 Transcript_33869/m.87562 type:complete len:238 (-) Transcript_33869:270-983(-)
MNSCTFWAPSLTDFLTASSMPSAIRVADPTSTMPPSPAISTSLSSLTNCSLAWIWAFKAMRDLHSTSNSVANTLASDKAGWLVSQPMRMASLICALTSLAHFRADSTCGTSLRETAKSSFFFISLAKTNTWSAIASQMALDASSMAGLFLPPVMLLQSSSNRMMPSTSRPEFACSSVATAKKSEKSAIKLRSLATHRCFCGKPKELQKDRKSLLSASMGSPHGCTYFLMKAASPKSS